MTHSDAFTPSTTRAVSLAAVAAAIGALLAVLPLSTPPLATTTLLTWWNEVGTPAAVVSFLRLSGILLAATVLVLALVGTLASWRPSTALGRLWHRLAPVSVRRLLAASVVAAGIATPNLAAATEARGAAPVLIDLGPVDPAEDIPVAPPALDDLGVDATTIPQADISAPVPVPAPVPATESPDGFEEWTVQHGDHLWHIAETTLDERDSAMTDAEVERYWRKLIDANRDTIGTDVDLIHPGLVLQLPK